MSNFVLFQIENLEENQELIAKLTKLLDGGKSTATAPTKEAKEESSTDGTVSKDDFKKAAIACKKDFGEDFGLEVLTGMGVEVNSTLGRSLARVDEADYAEVMEKWAAGPGESGEDLDDEDLDDEDDDLDLDDEEDASEIDPKAVSDAIKAFAKENGKDDARAIMAKHKIAKLADIMDFSQKQLATVMKAVS